MEFCGRKSITWVQLQITVVLRALRIVGAAGSLKRRKRQACMLVASAMCTVSSADLKIGIMPNLWKTGQMLWWVSSSPHYATRPDASHRHVMETVGAVQAEALYQERPSDWAR